MSNPIAMFDIGTECLRKGLIEDLLRYLKKVNARLSDDNKCATFTNFPLDATYEKHDFTLKSARTGWIETVRRNNQPLQFAISIQYPKRRLFSPMKKDWGKFIKAVETRFGIGNPIHMDDKQVVHFHFNDLKVLLSEKRTEQHALIEVKAAISQFIY